MLYPFAETRSKLYEGAKRAMAVMSNCRPYRLELPITAKKEFPVRRGLNSGNVGAPTLGSAHARRQDMKAGWQRFCRLCGTPVGGLACWFGFFTLLALVDAAQLYAGQHLEEFTISWATALRRGFESNYTMAVLGLGILWLARRFPFDRTRGWRWLGLHLGGALLYSLLFALSYSALVHGQMSVKGKPFVFGETIRKLLIFYTFGNVAFYWLILLAHHGWHYYQRYRERERRAAELEGELSRAQLHALRMQLNPHFLFNTLNTIAALIHEQPETADRVVVRLSELLRASLDRPGAHEIPLRQELDFLRRYLEIEQARFGDRLAVELQIGANLRDALVPALILQPVLENAIRHGVETRETAGRILVTAERQGERLDLCVADNGPGLPEGKASFPREGIGLSNTRSRLEHLYGTQQSLILTAAPRGGLEVRISLPFHTTDDHQPEPDDAAVTAAGLAGPAAP